MVLDFDTTKPFVLLEDSLGTTHSYLFTHAVAHIEAWRITDVDAALARVRKALDQGLFAAGWLGYEAGAAFEPRTARKDRDGKDRDGQAGVQAADASDSPLLWFGLFVGCQKLDPAAREALWRAPQPSCVRAGVERVEPLWPKADYVHAAQQALDLIAAGDAYQVNLTLPLAVDYYGSPLALYAHLREAQRVPFGALIYDGSRFVLSFSPEQFITREGNTLQARPMKGTAPLAREGAFLQQDAKNKAENLMIVDLLRNDLSRIAKPGSVQVPKLFALERYQTLWQMTSTIEATLSDGCDMLDVLKALIPCGSVTGAPKIRAQEIINTLEPTPRGLYCGAIGWIAPTSQIPAQAGFSVAIRTLVIPASHTAFGGRAQMGVGSGLVAQSDAQAEWAECMLKADFLTQNPRPFDLLETMHWTPDAGFWLLELHLSRMETSAKLLGFGANRNAWQTALAEAAQFWHTPKRVRLLLSRLGTVCVQAGALPKPIARPLRIRFAPLPQQASAKAARHKSSHRDYWDAARLALADDCDEVLFYNAEGYVCEGSFTSLFIQRTQMSLLETPTPSQAVVPGVLTQYLIQQGHAQTARLSLEDVRRAALVYVGNSVRGLMRAIVVEDLGG